MLMPAEVRRQHEARGWTRESWDAREAELIDEQEYVPSHNHGLPQKERDDEMVMADGFHEIDDGVALSSEDTAELRAIVDRARSEIDAVAGGVTDTDPDNH
jgi:hypothetical protein